MPEREASVSTPVDVADFPTLVMQAILKIRDEHRPLTVDRLRAQLQKTLQLTPSELEEQLPLTMIQGIIFTHALGLNATEGQIGNEQEIRNYTARKKTPR